METTLAYLAGVIDSDGYVSIKRRRHKDGGSGWTYHPIIQVRQAEKHAVILAQETFGGNLRLDPPAAPTRRSMHTWQVCSAQAVAAAKRLLPHMRIKHEQTLLVIEFGRIRADYRLRRRSYWYTIQPNEPTYDVAEAARIKGVASVSIYQAIRNGSVPVLPDGRRLLIPRAFWDSYTMLVGKHPLPPEYIALRESLHAKAKALNRVGPR